MSIIESYIAHLRNKTSDDDYVDYISSLLRNNDLESVVVNLGKDVLALTRCMGEVLFRLDEFEGKKVPVKPTKVKKGSKKA